MLKDKVWKIVEGLVDERYPEAEIKRYTVDIDDIIVDISNVALKIESDFEEKAEGLKEAGPDAHDPVRGHNLV